MNIVYGCQKTFITLYFANLLVIVENIPIKCIVFSKKPFTIEGVNVFTPSGLIFLIRRFGIQYIFYYGILFLLLPILNKLSVSFLRRKRLLSWKELSRKYNIRLVSENNFNEISFINEIKEMDTDIFLSMYLDQILQNPLIHTPKIASINIHPSLIPEFRGVDPIFQQMLNNRSTIGITIHEMTQIIDNGRILLNTEFDRSYEDSHLFLTYKFVCTGCSLFQKYITNYLLSRKCALLRTSQPNENSKYRSLPERKEIHEFLKNNLSFWQFKDLINWLILPDKRAQHSFTEKI